MYLQVAAKLPDSNQIKNKNRLLCVSIGEISHCLDRVVFVFLSQY